MSINVMARFLKAIALFPSLCLGTMSCALADGPDLDGLELVSVKVIEPNGSPDATLGASSPWPNRTVLVVDFSARQSLVEYAKQHEYNIVNVSSYCEGTSVDSAKSLQNNPHIFDASGIVDAFREGPSGTDNASETQPIYHIYIAIRPVPLAGQDVFSYDLHHDREDVCVQLRGGNMLGSTFVSNTIVVPNDTIANALSVR